MTAYAFFVSSVVPLIDSLALQRVATRGGSYAHLRLFGSLGFVLTSSAFGFAIHAPGARATVIAPLALISAVVLWSLTLRVHSPPASAPHPLDGLRLLRRRELSLLLAASCLHWIACTPYHGMLSIHLAALGLPPSVVGVSAALGVSAEVLVLLLHPRLASRLPAPRLLQLAFAVSAVRWAGMAWAVHPEVIIALSLLHGMTFGAFYVAALAWLARHVPAHLRASGQALFAAVTFGVGGLVGYLGSGAAYDVIGGHRLFAVAAGLELLAALLARRLEATERGA
jgi:PPP family 3-phenylpropionic acid transporter